MTKLNCITYIPEDTKKALILMHGYGDNNSGMTDLIDDISASVPNTAIYCPNAPESISVSSYVSPLFNEGRQWFDLSGELSQTGNVSINDFDDICISMLHKAQKAMHFIEELSEDISKTHKIPFSDICLAGFSQGATLALTTAFFGNHDYNSALDFSGLLCFDNVTAIKHKPPVFLCHGTEDEVIPYIAYKAMLDILQSANIRVTDFTMQGQGHTITKEALFAAINFLNTNLTI